LKKLQEKFDLEKILKNYKDTKLDIELIRRKNEKLCEENNVEIKELETKIYEIEEALKTGLHFSGEDKLECKLGSVSFKVMPDEWKYQDEILMSWIISLPSRLKYLYLTVTTTIKKAELKKQIMLDNSVLFEASKLVGENTDVNLFLLEGEVFDINNAVSHKVEGIEIKHQDPKFSITIKNLKK